MKVVAFNGSPRKEGNTSLLIKHVFTELNSEGIETESVQVGGETIRGCAACYKCFASKDRRCAMNDDIANACVEKMIEADGIIIGSPTYFAAMTPETKALIDRCGMVTRANGDLLKRKAGAAVVTVRGPAPSVSSTPSTTSSPSARLSYPAPVNGILPLAAT